LRIPAIIFMISAALLPTQLVAAPDHGLLESALRQQLDRIFDDGEYIMDVQTSPLKESKSEAPVPLPGLAFTWAPVDPLTGPGIADNLYKNRNIDVLIVVDAAVTQERLRVADEVARRLLVNASSPGNFSLKVRKQAIAKPEAPKPPPPPKVDPPKSMLEQLEENKGLVIRAAALLWGAIVSLMAIYGVIRRYSTSAAGNRAQQSGSAADSGRPLATGNGEGPKTNDAASPRAKAATKEELYSKDQALMKQVEDLVSEARGNAPKVAKVLTRWVSAAGDSARHASIFLKNCDVKTMEALAECLHPADIEAIMLTPIDDFDMFSDENQKVLELLRGELALLSAERILKDRPDPLDFAKILTDDDILTLVKGEPFDVVALIATQIPPHRMQKYYATLSAEKLSELFARISTIAAPTFSDFDVVREALVRKATAMGSTLFDQRGRIKTVAQLFNVIQSPVKLEQVAREMARSNPDTFHEVRPKTLLPSDICNLPQRAVAVLAQGIDPETFALALSVGGLKTDLLQSYLPEAYQVIFRERLSGTDDSSQDASWRKLASTVRELVANGLISERELAGARTLTDQAYGDLSAGNEVADAQLVA